MAPLAVLLGIVLWSAAARPQLIGDTHGLVLHSENVVRCLDRHQFTKCDRRADGMFGGKDGGVYRTGNVGQWPLAQYLIAVPLRALGLSTDVTLRALILLDAAAFVLSLLVVWRVTRRLGLDAWGPVLVLALVVSPLLWYSTVAFGEVLAGALLLAVVVAVLGRWHPLALGVVVALACVTKETNPPFVLALAALASVAADRRRTRRIAVPAVLGAAAGVVLNAAFNVFRFGRLGNSSYTQSTYRPPGLAIESRMFGALVVSPNGGLLWFWPAAVAVLVLGVVAAASATRRGVRRSWAPWGVPLLLLANLAGLALWYSPFGWIAWGPRLSLPLIPPLLLLAAVFAGRRGVELLQRLLHSAWIWVVAVVTTVGGLPQLGFLHARQVLKGFFTPTGSCLGVHIEADRAAYYRCTGIQAWHQHPILLDAIRTLGSPLGFASIVALVSTIAGLLVLARTTPAPKLARHGVDPG